jgi:hypothetical protein
MDADLLVHFSKLMNEGVRRLAESECVLLGQLRLTVEWGTVAARQGVHDTGNGRINEEGGAVHTFFAKGEKHVHVWAVSKMFLFMHLESPSKL